MHADVGMHAITASRIKRSTTNPILVLTATGSGADDMAAAIGDFAPDGRRVSPAMEWIDTSCFEARGQRKLLISDPVIVKPDRGHLIHRRCQVYL